MDMKNNCKTQGNSTLIAMRIRRRRQVAVMLVINGVMFFICCTIINILVVISFATSIAGLLLRNEFYVLLVSNITSLLNSSINPVVYGATNNEYRRAFREYLCGV